MKTRFPSPRVPEKVVQQQVADLLRASGAKVYTLGTVRRRGDHPGTMQTPGLPDLVAFLKRKGLDPHDSADPSATRQLLFVECKAEGGRLRPEQIEFRGLSIAADVAHITGGLDDVIAWLIQHGYRKADQFAHYRTRAIAQEHSNGR